VVVAIAAISALARPASTRHSGYWVPLKPAVAADGLDCTTGAVCFTARCRL